MAVELDVAYFDLKSEFGDYSFGSLVEDAVNLSCDDLQISVRHYRKSGVGNLSEGINNTISRTGEPVDVVVIETERLTSAELQTFSQVAQDLGTLPVVIIAGFSNIDPAIAKKCGIAGVVNFGKIELPADITEASADDLFWSAAIGMIHGALKAQGRAVAA